tara:strand:+ start:297 stop:695 length:399 start_codon:yes stop_codon:yes gene_type:complete
MKRLYKERFDKKFLGVCGGLAQYFKFDASIIRLLFVLGTIFSGGIILIIYLVLGLVMPYGPKSYIVADYRKLYRSRSDRRVAGVCGGLGKYLRIDSNILRIVLIVICLVTAVVPIVLFYLLAIGIIPEEPTS